MLEGNKQINICVPVLNRYDKLVAFLTSLESGTIKPDNYYIIDNGNRLNFEFPRMRVIRPGFNVGCAAAWNFFLDNVSEIRIICNDDLIFAPYTLEKLIKGYNDENITCPDGLSASMFSCFLLSDKVVKDVGRFDESISPNYGYFEDNDYYYRLTLKNRGVTFVEGCSIEHDHSSTLKAMNNIELQEHHRKFGLAQSNYFRKWGGPPTQEKFTIPFGK